MRVILLPRRFLAWLALVLCCGALLWYAFSRPPAVTTGVAVQDQLPPARPHQSGTPAPVPDETSGDARGFAVETAMERERARSERLEWLQAISSDPATSSVTRDDAQRRLLQELDRAEKEQELTRLLEAEGFKDSLVVLNDRGLTLSLRGRLADVAVAARLGELASRMTGLPPERIVIMDGR
ncbi:MAG: SpoIIIAH-like family protein [Bacillota bacterium]|nr:SpoIIIAH-like family protein [Bacillota bacterium]